jgi:hypothetical protein
MMCLHAEFHNGSLLTTSTLKAEHTFRAAAMLFSAVQTAYIDKWGIYFEDPFPLEFQKNTFNGTTVVSVRRHQRAQR